MSSRSLTIRKQQDLIKKEQGELARTIEHGLEWVVADCSGSMGIEIPGQPGKTRLDCLNDAVRLTDDRVRWLGFADRAIIQKTRQPFDGSSYGYGTNFDAAFRALAPLEPSYVIFLSDGESSVSDELVAKVAESAIIDTIYIGQTDEGKALLQRIAEIGHGRFKHWDASVKQTLSLTSVIQGLLPAPSDDGDGEDAGVIKL